VELDRPRESATARAGSKARHLTRLSVIAVVISAITAQHYLISVSHENLWLHNIHYLLYFLPVLMAGIWYGLWGGGAMAILVCVLYAPVVFGPHAQHVFSSNTQKALELIIYNLVGWVTGILSYRQRREGEGWRRTAEELREAYARLSEKTDLIIEKDQQLRRAEKLSTLGELAAGIAHEIRNPLASIKGTAEILLDKSTPEPKRVEFMRLMLDETRRLNDVVSNFLRLARFQRLSRERADLNDIFRRMLQIVDLQPASKKIDFRTEFASDLPRASLDVSQMEQAILNLLLNSVGAMPDGGELTLSTRSEQNDGADLIIAEVADTGEGIRPEDLPRVFEPLFTTKSDGTGMGLAIVRRILKAHGGSIDIQSEPGAGTRATLTIPIDSETTP
jgi:signal transduction histidine kinase